MYCTIPWADLQGQMHLDKCLFETGFFAVNKAVKFHQSLLRLHEINPYSGLVLQYIQCPWPLTDKDCSDETLLAGLSQLQYMLSTFCSLKHTKIHTNYIFKANIIFPDKINFELNFCKVFSTYWKPLFNRADGIQQPFVKVTSCEKHFKCWFLNKYEIKQKWIHGSKWFLHKA